jgi:drug/metabolite transporter (DMT)-like permease
LMSFSAFGNAMLFFLALLLFTMFLSLFRSHFFWYLMILNHSNLDCMSGSMI